MTVPVSGLMGPDDSLSRTRDQELALAGPVRYPELDVIKAAAIVAVVTIHSIRPFWLPDISEWEKLVLLATRFGVPAFLAVSGFLYFSPTPISFSTILRRLRRVLLPYLFVSIAAAAYGHVYPGRLTVRSLWKGVLLGAFFGPYYYVFLLVTFIFASWVLCRLPRRPVTLLAAAALVTVFVSESWKPEMWKPFKSIWEVRNPLLWGGWFMLGWAAAAHRDWVFSFARRYRTAILRLCGTYCIAWAILMGTGVLTGRPARTGVVTLILTSIVGLFALRPRARQIPQFVEQISDWTYSLYLLHPFFIYFFQDTVAPALGLTVVATTGLSALAGLLGALGVTILGRFFLGEQSRHVIGS